MLFAWVTLTNPLIKPFAMDPAGLPTQVAPMRAELSVKGIPAISMVRDAGFVKKQGPLGEIIAGL